MKKLSIGLLAAALSLPFAFAATQAPATTQTAPSKTNKKQTKTKKAHHKKASKTTKTPPSK